MWIPWYTWPSWERAVIYGLVSNHLQTTTSNFPDQHTKGSLVLLPISPLLLLPPPQTPRPATLLYPHLTLSLSIVSPSSIYSSRVLAVATSITLSSSSLLPSSAFCVHPKYAGEALRLGASLLLRRQTGRRRRLRRGRGLAPRREGRRLR